MMVEEDQAIQDLMDRAAAIACRTMGKQGVAEAFVLAIYHELKKAKPKSAVTYPRITKMWVERNNHDNGSGGWNTDIHSRMLEVQFSEHYFKNVRISKVAYEQMGGTER